MMLVPRHNFNIFDDFFDEPFFTQHENKIMKTDIKEHNNKYELLVDLPGFNKEDIKISINAGYLEINAKSSSNNDEKDDDGKFIRQERYYGECSRKFYVGENISEEEIKASFKDGILNVEVPKKENIETKEKKYIEIN